MRQRANAPKRKAESYRDVAEQTNWYGYLEVRERTLLEVFARDSFENVLYSVACFRAKIGHYPTKLTIVGWQFKEERFDLHRLAIQWPQERFLYVGVNNPPEGPGLEGALVGEKSKLVAVRNDFYSFLSIFPWLPS